VFRFMHLAPEKADYKCSFKSANPGATASSCGFDAPAAVTAPPSTSPGGVEVVLEVGFEPSSVGESLRDTLVVASAVGGEYQVPLVGRCLPPKPQGPIDVAKVGGSCWGVGWVVAAGVAGGGWCLVALLGYAWGLQGLGGGSGFSSTEDWQVLPSAQAATLQGP
jgi:hypothetical protein